EMRQYKAPHASAMAAAVARLGDPHGAAGGAPLINFILDPLCRNHGRRGAALPDALRPDESPMTHKIKKLPNSDPTETHEKYDFAEPVCWTANEKSWKPIYERIAKGS